jgi:serine/threonine-protein kinase HipA
MASESLYVFVEIDGEAVVVGRLTITATLEGKLGHFVYGQSYLSRTDAFALDPINLPLEEKDFTTPDENYIFGVFNDAAPDLWGKRVIDSFEAAPATNDFKYLLQGSGQGVGALLFSRSPKAPHVPVLGHEKIISNVTKMQQAAATLEQKGDLAEQLKHYLQGGISMGGVRPKTVLAYRGVLWLAKFPMQSDLYDCQKAEFAALAMAEDAGIRVPNRLLLETELGSVLLVERFDRIEGRRQHFISAHSLLDTPRKLRQAEYVRHASYANIADIIGRVSANPQEDRCELFLRMVFNIAIGNGDDHLKNHGFLKQEHHHHLYRLSPAYDLLTQPTTGLEKRQAIVVGAGGVEATFANALSHCGRFGLTTDQAQQLIDKTLSTVGQRGTYFALANLTDTDAHEIDRRMALRAEEYPLPPLQQPLVVTTHADILKGDYRGKFIDEQGQWIIQQIGANLAIAHNKICFAKIPALGDFCRVTYRNAEVALECGLHAVTPILNQN